MNIRTITIDDYESVYSLWLNTPNMGLNNLDDSKGGKKRREGISKAALVVFGKNKRGNAFWEKQGFTTRPDLIYRNKAIADLTRIDT